MYEKDFIVFDTSTIPEYYDDVHKILALPEDHIVTYDYSTRNISDEAVRALDDLAAKLKANKNESARAVIAYIQPEAYKKGDGSIAETPLPPATFQTLTRLSNIVAVRTIKTETSNRYYIDLQLRGYPYDPGRKYANALIEELRKAGDIPMKTWITLRPSYASDALFAARADDVAFSMVVDNLSHQASQFHQDTFWRLTKVSYRTKSLWPLARTKRATLFPRRKLSDENEKSYSYLKAVDQSTLQFHMQFSRGKSEHGTDYRPRKIAIDATPKSASDLLLTSFTTRSFGQEIVAVSLPATNSLSTQEARFRIATQLHVDDAKKDYPYGPQLVIPVEYRKGILKTILAIFSIAFSSGSFAFAAFSTSTSTADLKFGYLVPLCARVIAVVLGILASLYAYYLWNDEITLDKVRRT
jgi:hypothetical protein